MSAPARPLRRVERMEALSRRAEALTHAPLDDVEPSELLAVVAEMGRELYRLAHALDEVV